MKPTWLKVVLLSALGLVVAIDLAHWILNRLFDPFTGPWDTAMHFILPVATLFYLIGCLWCCFRLVKWSSTTKFLGEGYHASMVLLVLIAGQLAFTLLASARSGSSSYHPLFPDFLAGIILALATLLVGRDYLHSRIGLTVVVLATFFWLAGSTTVDLLWWTERTNRGVGPMWQLPLLGPMLAAVSYLFIFGGRLVEAVLFFPETSLHVGSIVQVVWFLLLTVMLGWGLRWLAPKRVWPASLAVASSIVFLSWKAVEWASFIGD